MGEGGAEVEAWGACHSISVDDRLETDAFGTIMWWYIISAHAGEGGQLPPLAPPIDRISRLGFGLPSLSSGLACCAR